MQAYPVDAATLPPLWVGGGVGWCLTFVLKLLYLFTVGYRKAKYGTREDTT